METLEITGPEAVDALVGRRVGPTAWREVTQEMIDTFAGLTGDHQWIHVDVARARDESPFGATIAHGNLTLSLIDGFRDQLIEVTGFKLGVNYGWNRVRFPSPVIAGTRVRAWAELVEAEETAPGWLQCVTRFTVETDAGGGRPADKPCCVADSVTRLLRP